MLPTSLPIATSTVSHSPFCRRDPARRLGIAELEVSLDEDGLALAADLSRNLTLPRERRNASGGN